MSELETREESNQSALEDESFKWQVGQNLNPNRYTRLGQIWEKGKVWLSTRIYESVDASTDYEIKRAAHFAENSPDEAKAPVDPSKRRPGLAKEADLMHKEGGPLFNRLFGSSKSDKNIK